MTVTMNTQAVRERVRKAAMRGIIRGTEEIRNEAISLILNTPKTGRVYRHRGVEHQASAPGEAPASDTGDLVNSIETRYDFNKLSGVVVATSKHAPPLEYGTRNMEPRPFMRPALANKRQMAVDYVQEELAKEFKP